MTHGRMIYKYRLDLRAPSYTLHSFHARPMNSNWKRVDAQVIAVYLTKDERKAHARLSRLIDVEYCHMARS